MCVFTTDFVVIDNYVTQREWNFYYQQNEDSDELDECVAQSVLLAR